MENTNQTETNQINNKQYQNVSQPALRLAEQNYNNNQHLQHNQEIFLINKDIQYEEEEEKNSNFQEQQNNFWDLNDNWQTQQKIHQNEQIDNNNKNIEYYQQEEYSQQNDQVLQSQQQQSIFCDPSYYQQQQDQQNLQFQQVDQNKIFHEQFEMNGNFIKSPIIGYEEEIQYEDDENNKKNLGKLNNQWDINDNRQKQPEFNHYEQIDMEYLQQEEYSQQHEQVLLSQQIQKSIASEANSSYSQQQLQQQQYQQIQQFQQQDQYKIVHEQIQINGHLSKPSILGDSTTKLNNNPEQEGIQFPPFKFENNYEIQSIQNQISLNNNLIQPQQHQVQFTSVHGSTTTQTLQHQHYEHQETQQQQKFNKKTIKQQNKKTAETKGIIKFFIRKFQKFCLKNKSLIDEIMSHTHQNGGQVCQAMEILKKKGLNSREHFKEFFLSCDLLSEMAVDYYSGECIIDIAQSEKVQDKTIYIKYLKTIILGVMDPTQFYSIKK